MQRKTEILYICQNAIGDIIVSLPSIHALKQVYKDSVLHVAINKEFSGILIADRKVDFIIEIPSIFFSSDKINSCLYQKYFNAYYDIIIDAMSIRNSAEVIKRLGCRVSAGIGFNGISSIYDKKIALSDWRRWSDSTRNASDVFCDFVRLLGHKLGRVNPPQLYLHERSGQMVEKFFEKKFPNQNVVAFNPGAGSQLKRWGMSHFVKVAKCFSANHEIAFIFGPKEKGLLKSYRRKLSRLGFVIIDSFPIQKLACFLAKVKLLITNDCAVMHIGASAGCKTVAVFGPSDSRIWFPYSRSVNKVIESKIRCRKTCQFNCVAPQCLEKITVDKVCGRLRNWMR